MALQAVLALCILRGGAALSTRRAPDTDHLIHEIHDNANYEESKNAKPTDTVTKDFVALDRDNSGSLDTEELMFRQYVTGCEPQEAQVRATDYFRCGDLNKDGQISLQEFNQSTSPAWVDCIKESSARRTHGFVRFFDADGDYDDKLSKTELRVGVLQLWGTPGDELVDPLMACADKNKDGSMDQDEFHNSIAAYNPSTRSWQMWNGTSDKEILKCMEPAFKKFDAALVFHATDTSKDGKLSRQELYNVMRTVNGISITQKDADAIFDAADADKNKYLNLDEFAKAGEAYKGANEAGFFLTGRGLARTNSSLIFGHGRSNSSFPLDTYDEGYGMSIQCHSRDGQPWRIFSDGLANAPKKEAKNAKK